MKMIVCIGLLALLIPMGVIRSRRGVSENRVDGQLDTDTEVPVDKVAAAARKKGSSKLTLASRDMKAVQFPVTAAGDIELTTKSGLKDVNSHAFTPSAEFTEKDIKMLESVKANKVKADLNMDVAGASASLDKTKAESAQDKTKAESAMVDTAGASFLLDKVSDQDVETMSNATLVEEDAQDADVKLKDTDKIEALPGNGTLLEEFVSAESITPKDDDFKTLQDLSMICLHDFCVFTAPKTVQCLQEVPKKGKWKGIVTSSTFGKCTKVTSMTECLRSYQIFEGTHELHKAPCVVRETRKRDGSPGKQSCQVSADSDVCPE